MRPIDHIVYAVPNLEIAMDELETKMGIRPVFGGYHTTKGTKNALLNLGDNCYLEILAADDKDGNVKPPRWMGIDLIQESQITRWAIKSKNLKEDQAILQTYNAQMGEIEQGQRKTQSGQLLTWKMILPLAQPSVEIMPFMTDWQQSDIHPADQLEQHCSLTKLVASHPNPDQIIPFLKRLSARIEIIKSEEVCIKAYIQTPIGEVVL